MTRIGLSAFVIMTLANSSVLTSPIVTFSPAVVIPALTSKRRRHQRLARCLAGCETRRPQSREATTANETAVIS
jgi:hypothetical protein